MKTIKINIVKVFFRRIKYKKIIIIGARVNFSGFPWMFILFYSENCKLNHVSKPADCNVVWGFVSWNKKKKFLHVSRTPRRPKLTYNFYLTGTWAWDCCENHVNSLGETLAWEKEVRIVSSFTRRHMWYSNQIYNFFLKYVS